MTRKKVSSQVMPKVPDPSTDASSVPTVSAPRKRASAAVKKPVAKAPKSPLASKRTSASKVQPPSDKPAQAVDAKTKSRAPARSSARSPAPTQTRKPSRVKTKALPATQDQALKIEPTLAAEGLLEDTSASPINQPSDHPTPEKPAPEVSPPVLSVAELWEQGSPIRTRIAQLRTRNSLLEEQLQRLRPPVQVRGKKK